MKYISTRNKQIEKDDKIALLQGLSDDGGLFVLKDLNNKKIDITELLTKNYNEIALEILKLFFSFDEEKLKKAI